MREPLDTVQAADRQRSPEDYAALLALIHSAAPARDFLSLHGSDLFGIGSALVSMTHSITILPREFLTAIEVLSVCTSIPIYLTLVIKGCSFPEKFEQRHSKRTPKGAPFL
jgi:hypothetical protein